MNQKTFNAFLNTHQDTLYKMVRSRVNTEQDADDILQEVLLKIYKNYGGFKGKAQLNTWFYTICRNAIADYYRNPWWKFKWRFKQVEQQTKAHQDPEQQLHMAEQQNKIVATLKTFPNKEQEVFTLRFFDHFSLQEIATCQKTSLSTTKTHLYRAVKKMRSALKEKEALHDR